MTLSWFDRWLKDEDNAVDTDPAVYYFTMGEDAWHAAERWPPPDFGSCRCSSVAAGRRTAPRATGPYPPDRAGAARHPTVTCMTPRIQSPAWAVPIFMVCPVSFSPVSGSRGPEGARPDVLVYTSHPLERDLEVTGNVTASLWATTSARDTDWTAKLVDVLPDGRSFNVCDGILRARFRDSFEAPVPVTPGDPHHAEIDLGPTSTVFGRGHRIRLHISSSNFPAHSRNLNTGGVNADEAEPVVATQTVLHDPDHPSHVRLPARWR